MDTMEIDDDVYMNKSLTMEGLIPSDFQRRKQPSRCATASLGVLCAVLLAGNIGQIIHYEIMSRPASADPTQPGHEALTANRKQLEAALTNATTDKDQLSRRLTSLMADRKQLEAALTNATTDKDQLSRRLTSLMADRKQLEAALTNATTDKDQLSRRLTSLMADRKQLEAALTNATTALEAGAGSLRGERDRLQASYDASRRELGELRRDYGGLEARNRRLQNSSGGLQAEAGRLAALLEQLQANRSALQRRYDGLQANYSSAAAERDRLLRKIDSMRRSVVCPPGWEKSDISCYLVSAGEANWTLSQQDCVAKGADLVVINSEDEQTFVSGLLEPGQNAWIGLTDSVDEGIWTWVDGTAVTTTYWQPGQPNSYNGNQDCGEMVLDTSGAGTWNDDGCFANQVWICEK